MNRLVGFATITLLAGCQGAGSGQPWASHVGVTGSVKPTDYSSCGPKVEPGIKPKGGFFRFTSVPSSGNFAGVFDYARLSVKLHVESTFYSCAQNVNGIPVPEGYTADWFGTWVICGGTCSFSFGTPTKKATMQVESTTWTPKTVYYLYVYTAYGGKLIESYEIGNSHTKGKLNDNLKFASPFANGLIWPTDDDITLEIVHAS